MEFSEGSLPYKYLGALLVESTIRQISRKELLDKINQNINPWTYRALNFLSRLILVKSVLQEMPIYLFSVLAALKLVIKQVINIHRNFLWEGLEGHRK